MFFMAMPAGFKVGDTAGCVINGKPANLTWRDEGTLVIEPADARVILEANQVGDLIHFLCADAGLGSDDYARDGLLLYEKEPWKRPPSG
jgi:hypothetical protein